MLSEAEEKAYQRLLKLERRWKWGRYVCLLIGVGVVATAIWLRFHWERNLLNTTRSMSFTESPSGAEVYFASQNAVILALSHIVFWFGVFIASFTVGRWRGNPAYRLLLGLAERARAQDSHTG